MIGVLLVWLSVVPSQAKPRIFVTPVEPTVDAGTVPTFRISPVEQPDASAPAPAPVPTPAPAPHAMVSETLEPDGGVVEQAPPAEPPVPEEKPFLLSLIEHDAN